MPFQLDLPVTMAKKVSERNITMGKEPPLFLKKNWGQFFSYSILNSDSDGASRIVLSLFVWMQFFFKMISNNYTKSEPPSPHHALAIISNRGPTFLHEHWFSLIFGVIFFLKYFEFCF